jgi:hypothetical protein
MSVLAVREHHRFEAAGRPFVYLVPSAAIFALDEAADDVMRTLGNGARSRDELVAELSARHAPEQLGETVRELAQVQAIGELGARPASP